jgi:formiminoglutamase
MKRISSSKIKIAEFTTIRTGEVKLGEIVPRTEIDLVKNEDFVKEFSAISANYVVLGIPEDIGVRANHGNPGAKNGYNSFLKYFCNMQSNSFTNPDEIHILGELHFPELVAQGYGTNDVGELRQICSELDELVYQIIFEIVKHGKTPIIIGGGHNNAYGNIMGSSIALGSLVDVLNIDPHADFRATEGRHSGNGFRYAFEDKFLGKYAVWGLNEMYNNQFILDEFAQNENLCYESFFNIISEKSVSIEKFISFLGPKIGFEIDLDSIKNMPSSAISPIGFSEEEILKFIGNVKSQKEIIYFHLSEGSPNADSQYIVGKFLAMAVIKMTT